MCMHVVVHMGIGIRIWPQRWRIQHIACPLTDLEAMQVKHLAMCEM